MTNLQRLSPVAAASELLGRRQARADLLAFTEYTYPRYIAEPVHRLIAQKLDGVVSGTITRLMIFAPPQHGKSELTSIRLPAYWLGKRSHDPIILTSYAASLAQRNSRAARDVVESIEFQALFPNVKTREDSRAVHHWQLAGQSGGLLAAGVGGPVTGHGGLLGIIDDPFENWEQAQSLTIREKVWDWYRSTFRTRIWEDGAIVLIMTRWHEDDLAGRLLQDQAGEWEVLRLPAVAETQEQRDDNHRLMNLPKGLSDPLGREPGEPLSPQRFSQNALDGIRRDVGSMAWVAEYQNAPRAPEGNRFKRSWFPIVDDAPDKAQRIRYWDKAGTEGGGAYTAGVRIAKSDAFFCIEDVVRGQWSAYERESIIRRTAEQDGKDVTIYIEQEPGSGGKESAEATIRNLAGFRVYADRPTGDKDVRLEPFAAQSEAGNVKLKRGNWNLTWLDEITTIPNSQYRDQGDATAGAFNQLAKPRTGRILNESIW